MDEKEHNKEESKLNFKELSVWKKSVEWAREVILLADNLQTDRKHYRLFEQLEAAVTSVSMNISEGKGRYSKKEFMHFLYIARGSAYETITLLNIFNSLNWITTETLYRIESEGTEIIKMINKLINTIKIADSS
ncbi:MAG: four helix bundle protein [Candidatus Kapaibacterium sp.]